MPAISIQVPFDSGGYRWVHRQNPGRFGSRSTQPEGKVYLEGAGYADLRGKIKEEQSVTWRCYEFETHYDPSAKEPALFRVFAELKPNESAILEFANRFGDIAEIPLILWGPGASLADWQKAIVEIRSAIKVGDLLVRKSASDAEIAEFVTELLSGLAANVTLSPMGNGIGLRAMGVGLLQAIKFQLADAVIERRGYRKCDFCGRPFELRPQVNRSDRVFCTDTCRVKSYQHRKKQAFALRKKGLTMQQIAKRTDSEMATLKKWFADQKRSGEK